MNNINWTALITNIGGVILISGSFWQGARKIVRAIREAERSKTKAEEEEKDAREKAEARTRHYEDRLRAHQERISIQQGIIEILSERINQIEEHLAIPAEKRPPYHIRKAGFQLQKQATQRYEQVKTDFTPPSLLPRPHHEI